MVTSLQISCRAAVAACRLQLQVLRSHISGNRFQLRAPEEVAAEIHELKTFFAVQHIWFGDDILPWIATGWKKFANAVESHGEVVPFKIQSRADLMNDTNRLGSEASGL